jgi:hypothetical protein
MRQIFCINGKTFENPKYHVVVHISVYLFISSHIPQITWGNPTLIQEQPTE